MYHVKRYFFPIMIQSLQTLTKPKLRDSADFGSSGRLLTGRSVSVMSGIMDGGEPSWKEDMDIFGRKVEQLSNKSISPVLHSPNHRKYYTVSLILQLVRSNSLGPICVPARTLADSDSMAGLQLSRLTMESPRQGTIKFQNMIYCQDTHQNRQIQQYRI